MGKKLEKDAGAIYRYYRGRLQHFMRMDDPKRIVFSPNLDFAYLTWIPQTVKFYDNAWIQKDGCHSAIRKCFITPCQESDFRPDGASLMPKDVFGLPIMGTLKSPVTTRMVNC